MKLNVLMSVIRVFHNLCLHWGEGSLAEKRFWKVISLVISVYVFLPNVGMKDFVDIIDWWTLPLSQSEYRRTDKSESQEWIVQCFV